MFEPKLEEPFEYIFSSLTDFKDSDLPEIKYFSGTATYSKKIKIDNTPVSDKLRIILDLGELHDIAELFINGENAGVLWYPPYETDISDFVRSGENIIEIKVTNNWANRLIGDEQYEADFEWGRDRGILTGRAMKDFPDWFINKQQRPSRERKTFNIWYYYRRDSDLKPAGLIGPVQIKEVYYRIIRDH